jgi:tripartite-type tricarboxylate transporter receptor subunit TctC
LTAPKIPMKRKTFLAALVAAFCFASAAQAQPAFPNRTITLVSSFPAGSGNDLTARAIAPGLAEVLGQPVIVDNKPGAGGAIGAQYVARAKPDGYVLYLASLSFSILPNIQELSFDPAKDFVAVSLVGEQPMVFVVPASFPADSMNALVALAKSKPRGLNYASAGVGSIGHLTGELLNTERGIDIVHVPFKGTPEALTAIISGEVQMGLITVPAAEPQIKAGKVKPIAVTGVKRYPGLPQVPTLVEAGFPSLSDSVWYAVLAPAATPPEIVAKLNAALRQAIAQPATIERLEGPAKTSPRSSTPQEATSHVRAQLAKWNAVAAKAGLKPPAAK